MSQLEFADGAVIFREEDPSLSAYLILGGEVEVSKRSAKPIADADVVLAVLGPGQLLGEMGAIDGGPRSATARARGTVTLAEIPADRFRANVRGQAKLAGLLVEALIARLRTGAEAATWDSAVVGPVVASGASSRRPLTAPDADRGAYGGAAVRSTVSARPLHFKAGDIIFHAGDPSAVGYIIQSGDVEISVPTADGLHRIGTVKAGEVLGEIGVVENRPRSGTARALTRVIATEVPREAFHANLIATIEATSRSLVDRLRNIDRQLAGGPAWPRPAGSAESAGPAESTPGPARASADGSGGGDGLAVPFLPRPFTDGPDSGDAVGLRPWDGGLDGPAPSPWPTPLGPTVVEVEAPDTVPYEPEAGLDGGGDDGWLRRLTVGVTRIDGDRTGQAGQRLRTALAACPLLLVSDDAATTGAGWAGAFDLVVSGRMAAEGDAIFLSLVSAVPAEDEWPDRIPGAVDFGLPTLPSVGGAGPGTVAAALLQAAALWAAFPRADGNPAVLLAIRRALADAGTPRADPPRGLANVVWGAALRVLGEASTLAGEELGGADGGRLLDAAVIGLHAAERLVRGPTNRDLLGAVQAAMAHARLARGTLRSDEKDLVAADDLFRTALATLDAKHMALLWAETNRRHGEALTVLGRYRPGATLLTRAEAAFGRALTVFTARRAPRARVRTLEQEARVRRLIGVRQRQAAPLKAAVADLRDAVSSLGTLAGSGGINSDPELRRWWARLQAERGAALAALAAIEPEPGLIDKANEAFAGALTAFQVLGDMDAAEAVTRALDRLPQTG